MSDYLDPNNEELLKDFFLEAQAQIEILEQNFLVIENDHSNKEAIDEIFRAAHTLKGNSATVQMAELTEFTHLVEDLLDEIRSGNVKINAEMIDTLFESMDIIKLMLDERMAGRVYEEDLTGIKGKLKSYMDGETAPAPSEPVEEPTAQADEADKKEASVQKSDGGLSEYDLLELREAAGSGAPIYKVAVRFDENNPMNTVGGIQVFAALKDNGKILRTNPDFDDLYEDNFFPVVEYFFVSELPADKVQKIVSISDVTLGADIIEIGESAGAKKAVKSAAADKKDSSPEPVKTEAPKEVEKPAETEKTVEAKQEAPKEDKTAPKAEDAKEKAEAKNDDQKKKAADAKKQANAIGSILRVDSKRIDNILNLVSEAVINKATFNQISNQFAENLVNLQNARIELGEGLKDLFDSLPDFIEEIRSGRSLKEVRNDINNRFGNLFHVIDNSEVDFKSTVNKFRNTAQNLSRTTGDLHEGVLRIRMVPISQIFSRFPRLVRDLSRSLKKKIKLILEGEDTELDKSVIEDLLDPLIHCVRNSIDHGIEGPEDREAAGKPLEGHVLLKASNEGNMINIEIADDGKGIDVDSVRNKAIERGILHQSKNLSDIEAFNLIFEPGFSTAGSITNISGRGVGLDVVRKQIEKLNGNVSVWSELGKGTKITIKLPLTLAIIQGLQVRVASEVYIIPITSVLDSHRIKPSEIKRIDNYEVFNVRDDVISLIRLNRLFRLPEDQEKEHYFVVVVGSGDKKMGLIVDSLIGEEDVVIKPLRDQYTNSPGIAGATILGDGTVSLIIDVSQLVELGLKKERGARKRREAGIV